MDRRGKLFGKLDRKVQARKRSSRSMVVRVREITDEEGNQLRRIVRHHPSAIEVKRAQVILASARGFTPPKIGVIARRSEDYVRTPIKAFDLHGFKMLGPKWGPGRPSRFSEEQRKAWVDLALSRPRDLGLPYTEGSLSRLREEAMKRGGVERSAKSGFG